jgi:dGTPase
MNPSDPQPNRLPVCPAKDSLIGCSWEESWLASYAMKSLSSRGRRYPEEVHPYRTIYQRDRERIVHSTAFRRLMGKTQVLVGQINDHHRTRLTHTLEVAQISRTIARRLRLNEDLTEAIALSHDLGHPPFGHAGEEALNECLKDHGGFDHNLYGLRRVDELEDRYPEFLGLNLSWEVREAFVQHSKNRENCNLVEFQNLDRPLLEAQVVDAADNLAYDTHDTDDALGIGLINLDDLMDIPVWAEAAKKFHDQYPQIKGDAFRTGVIREMIAFQVSDLIQETESRLSTHRISTLEDVRNCPHDLVGFSSTLTASKRQLEEFLQVRVYFHHRILRMATIGKRFLKALFEEFVRLPNLLPDRHFLRWKQPRDLHGSQDFPLRQLHPQALERIVGDYLAGMTDRFAQQEYQRLFHPNYDL